MEKNHNIEPRSYSKNRKKRTPFRKKRRFEHCRQKASLLCELVKLPGHLWANLSLQRVHDNVTKSWTECDAQDTSINESNYCPHE